MSMEGIRKGTYSVRNGIYKAKRLDIGGAPGINFVEYPPLVTKFSTFLPAKLVKCMLLLSWLFIVYSTHLRIRECSWFATLDTGRKLYFLFPSIACNVKVQTPRTNLWQISWGTINNNAKVNNLQLNSADREEKMTFSSSNES